MNVEEMTELIDALTKAVKVKPHESIKDIGDGVLFTTYCRNPDHNVVSMAEIIVTWEEFKENPEIVNSVRERSREKLVADIKKYSEG